MASRTAESAATLLSTRTTSLILVILALSFSIAHAQVNVTSTFLDPFNSARKSRSPDIPDLVWNETLANYSTSYAQNSGGCNPSTVPFVENESYGSITTLLYNLPISSAVEGWIDQGSYFNSTSKTCEDTSFCTSAYIQLIWKNSLRVGCGVANSTCHELNTWVTCSFDPKGNVDGELPY